MTAAIDLSSLFQPLPAPAGVPGNPPLGTDMPNSIHGVEVGQQVWIWSRGQWRSGDVIYRLAQQGVLVIRTRREGWELRCSIPNLLRVIKPWL